MTFDGFYHDGKTADRKKVRVVLGSRHLMILDEHGALMDEWPVSGLSLAEEVYRGQPVRIVHRARGEACVTVESHDILAPLSRYSDAVRSRHFAKRGPWSRLGIWVAILLAVVVGLVIAIPHVAGPLATQVPMEWEETMGKYVAQSLAKDDDTCTAPAGKAALARLVARLAATNESPYAFKVSVSDDDSVNAFAAPGGYIVILDGLIQAAESPDEVAGVLAHEMAHAIERHPIEGLIHALGLRLVVSVLVGDASALIAGAAEVGEQLLVLSYSREKEAQADRVGVEMLNKAGMRAGGLVDFFRRMKKERATNLPAAIAFLSTHPLHEDRIEAIEAAAKGGGPALTATQWLALKNICAGEQGD